MKILIDMWDLIGSVGDALSVRPGARQYRPRSDSRVDNWGFI